VTFFVSVHEKSSMPGCDPTIPEMYLPYSYIHDFTGVADWESPDVFSNEVKREGKHRGRISFKRHQPRSESLRGKIG
jgi:hypothetical protein